MNKTTTGKFYDILGKIAIKRAYEKNNNDTTSGLQKKIKMLKSILG